MKGHKNFVLKTHMKKFISSIIFNPELFESSFEGSLIWEILMRVLEETVEVFDLNEILSLKAGKTDWLLARLLSCQFTQQMHSNFKLKRYYVQLVDSVIHPEMLLLVESAEEDDFQLFL